MLFIKTMNHRVARVLCDVMLWLVPWRVKNNMRIIIFFFCFVLIDFESGYLQKPHIVWFSTKQFQLKEHSWIFYVE